MYRFEPIPPTLIDPVFALIAPLAKRNVPFVPMTKRGVPSNVPTVIAAYGVIELEANEEILELA
jgi:hypothetical protein